MTNRRSDQCPFTRALEEYVASRPTKSKTPKFVRELQERIENGESLAKRAVSQSIIQLEQETGDNPLARNARRVLRPIVTVLNDYATVLDTFCQADPMLTAIIWGCLKAAIQSSSRFLGLYDMIKDHLTDLRTHLEVLTEYKELFGGSSPMQELLQTSYIDVIRFWQRVE